MTDVRRFLASQVEGSWTSAAWLLAIGLVAWLPSLHPGIETFDSTWLVRDNPLLNQGDPGRVGTILFDLSVGARRTLGSEYLPVRDLTVLFDFALWGGSWTWHHAQNLAWYLASAVIWLRIVQALLGAGPLAFGVAALYVVHPVHVESVAWLASRKDVVSLFFFLAATWRWVVDPHRGRAFAVAFPCFLLAVWSKNTAIVLPGILFLASVFVRREDLRRLGTWASFFAFGVAAVGCTALSVRVGSVVGMYAERRGGGGMGAVLVDGAVLLRYLGMLLWPTRLSPLYPEPVVGTGAWLGLGLGGALVAAGVASWRRRPLVSLGIGWFFLALLPVSQVVPLQNLMADRYLLLPSAGLLLAVAAMGARWPRALTVVLGVATALGVVATGQRCLVWRDPLSLWFDAHAKYPDEPRISAELAGALVEDDRVDEALSVLDDALARGDDSLLYQSRGWARMVAGREIDAESDLRRALQLQPDRAKAANNLVHLLLRAHRLDDAVDVGARLVALRPMYPEGWNAYGAALLEARRLDEARAALSRAQAMAPFDASTACNLGSVAFLDGDTEGARSSWARCLELDPGNDYARRGIEALSAGTPSSAP